MSKGFRQGFTLVEIIVVLSLMALLILAAIPAYNNFSDTRSLENAVSDLLSDLNDVRSRSTSVIKPEKCQDKILKGYIVTFEQNARSISAVCGDEIYQMSEKKIDDRVALTSSSPDIFFTSPEGTAVTPVEVILKMKTMTRTVKVDRAGTIFLEK